MTLRPAVFLDRDGVLNEPWIDGDVARGPQTLDQLVIVPGARAELQLLRSVGFALVAITNQPDVATGTVSLEAAMEMNSYLADQLGLDAVYMCPHNNAGGCPCRKPKPGMLLSAAEDVGLDLPRSWLIGDRWVDILAGEAAGVRPLLVERDYSWRSTSAGAPPPGLRPLHRAAGLPGCVHFIMEAVAGSGR